MLKHPLLTFTDEDIQIIADAFGTVIGERSYTCYACSIMPDHVHLLLRRHRETSEMMLEAFQSKSRDVLIDAGKRSPTHPVWGGPGWKRFLNTRADFERVERYIQRNPEEAGRLQQHWGFVTKYDAWMPGSSPKRAARERET